MSQARNDEFFLGGVWREPQRSAGASPAQRWDGRPPARPGGLSAGFHRVFVLWEIPCQIRQHTLQNIHYIMQESKNHCIMSQFQNLPLDEGYR